MLLVELFKRVTVLLRERGIPFAIAGGFAADIYRAEHRVTQDIDISILADNHPEKVGADILNALGLKPGVARQADLAGGPLFAIRSGRTTPCMVIGRPAGDPHGPGVDILLPGMGWVPEAVRRAQENLIDYGFGPVPTLTVEDVLLAKFAALKGSSARFKDLDDLASIFGTRPNLDMAYLAGQMLRLQLTVPKAVAGEAPADLRRVSRNVAKEMRRGRAADK